MLTVFIVLGTFAGLLLIAAPFVYIQIRTVFRQHKNFERGLKMVPLLIHLPPSSEDTQVGSRDVRDVTDETISQAEVLYGIIASTFEKGFKRGFYGQRHVAFEIVGTRGIVQFYAAVPVVLVEVVKQAVVSAYPAARMEEVPEHNIFNPVGKITGTVGGELTLKEDFAYPIETYQELKRDAMQSILNALSSLDKEDGVGIQIMMRPANASWRAQAHEVAKHKRTGVKKKTGGQHAVWWFSQLLFALWRPPEGRDGDKKELSALDQNIVDSIDAKTRHPGFEVLIRIVASSNEPTKAQAILNNVVATFSLFDAPGKNGFKYTAAKDIERFVTAYILRFFPQEDNSSILNTVELATLFHFPDQNNIPTSQLERQSSKQVDGPRNISEEGLLLGYNLFRGIKKPIRLMLNDRQRHMYVVGQTGTGKSTFLENLALQDMLNGDGFAFVDPHGDTVDRILAMVPRERTEDVIYFSPGEMDFPMGLNLFEFHTPEQKDFLIQETINMLYKLYDPTHQGIIGPRYEHWFRNAALTLMSDPGGATFIDIPKVFTDNKYAKQKLVHVTDQTVLDFWNKEMASTSDYHKSEVLGWFVSKFGAFLSNEMMRNVIGQVKSSFNLREVMDNKKILLVNLSKGRTGELNSMLLGMIFVMKFQAAAMSRASIPEAERVDFCLYVDEFQNFSTDSFATIMSEARKYRLNLIVANQFTTQLTEEIRDAVYGNMGTIVAFRVGQNDVDSLSRYFQPTFDSEDLLRVPNYNTITRTLIGGVPTQPFSMATLPPLGTPNMELAAALKQLSAAKYGRPKAQVEKEIFARLATKEEPKPAFGSSNPFAAAGPVGSPIAGASRIPTAPAVPAVAGVPPAPRPPASGSSFLDEWLAKRRQNPAGPPPAVAPTNAFARAPQPVSGVPGAPVLTPQPVAPTNPPVQSLAGPPPALRPSPASTVPAISNLQTAQEAVDSQFGQAPISLSLPNLDSSTPKPTPTHQTSNHPTASPPVHHAAGPTGVPPVDGSAPVTYHTPGSPATSDQPKDITNQDISALADELQNSLGTDGSPADQPATDKPEHEKAHHHMFSIKHDDEEPEKPHNKPIAHRDATPEDVDSEDTISIDREGRIQLSD